MSMRQTLQTLIGRLGRARAVVAPRAQVAIELRPAALMAARIEDGRLARMEHRACRPDQRRNQLEDLRRSGWFDGAAVQLMLGTPQRQLNSTLRPPVPDAELRDALRWQLRDSLDYPPEEAILDPLPVASTEPAGREEVLVFSVRRSELAPLTRPFDEAGIELHRVSVIDCAQRNLARHWVGHAGATAMLLPCAGGLLCTVSRGQELILSRALDAEPGLADNANDLSDAAERVALQMQRVFDLLERRSAEGTVTTIVIADWGPTAPLLQRVAALVGPRAVALPIDELLGVPSTAMNTRADAPHEFAHLLGTCLIDAPVREPETTLRPFAVDPRFAAGLGVTAQTRDDTLALAGLGLVESATLPGDAQRAAASGQTSALAPSDPIEAAGQSEPRLEVAPLVAGSFVLVDPAPALAAELAAVASARGPAGGEPSPADSGSTGTSPADASGDAPSASRLQLLP